MADFRKLARRNLPPSPAPAEATGNLHAPETAPEAPQMDGRSLRAIGRTKQIATRIREDFHDELPVHATTHRFELVEVLEQAFTVLRERDRQEGSS